MFSVVSAAPPGSPYQPGETLDPSCAPGDLNCTVSSDSVSAFTEDVADIQTTNATPSILYSLSLAEGEAVNMNAEVVAAGNSAQDRFLFKYGGLFYREAGGNVSQQDALLNLGGPILSSGGTQLVTSPDMQFDISLTGVGTMRYTWDGNGTDPNFASNGVVAGSTVDINSPNLFPENVGQFSIVGVTDDYIEVNQEGSAQLDVVDINMLVTSPAGAAVSISANTTTQSVDVMVTGASGKTLNWEGSILYKKVSSP